MLRPRAYFTCLTAVLFAVLVFVVWLLSSPTSLLSWPQAVIEVGGTPLRVHVAATNTARTQGLSRQPSLTADSGVLFLFPSAERYAFWMKEMHFPIDIIWIGENDTVVEVHANVEPSSYPQTFLPPTPVTKVVEVDAGWAAQHGVTIGAPVVLSESLPQPQ